VTSFGISKHNFVITVTMHSTEHYEGGTVPLQEFPDASSFEGVAHGDDLIYLFPSESISSGTKLTEKDEQVVDIMTTVWTNFAQTR